MHSRIISLWIALLACVPAHAAVWGYIDEQGKAHIATEKLDDRYQLFFKGPTRAELAAAAKPPGPVAERSVRQDADLQAPRKSSEHQTLRASHRSLRQGAQRRRCAGEGGRGGGVRLRSRRGVVQRRAGPHAGDSGDRRALRRHGRREAHGCAEAQGPGDQRQRRHALPARSARALRQRRDARARRLQRRRRRPSSATTIACRRFPRPRSS